MPTFINPVPPTSFPNPLTDEAPKSSPALTGPSTPPPARPTNRKSTTLELTLDPDYVQNWGVWEALREFLQNGLDARDKGFAFSVRRSKTAKKTLFITTQGCVLERSTLLLGNTGKSNDEDARGKFGEGYKLGFLVLCRLGYEVQLRTGWEIWTPYIEKSEVFGEELLKIKIRPTTTYANKIEVRVYGISDAEWYKTRANVLGVPGFTPLRKKDFVQAGSAKILLNPLHAGSLYCSNLYVGPLPSGYKWGFDLPAVDLDRDRKMANPSSLDNNVRVALLCAVADKTLDPEMFVELMGQECGEAEAIARYYFYKSTDFLSFTASKLFRERYGDDAVPVLSSAEALEAEHYGLRPHITTPALKRLIESQRGTFLERKQRAGAKPVHIYCFAELGEKELINRAWALDLLSAVRPAPTFKPGKVRIVKFQRDTVDGTYDIDSGRINIARHCLNDRKLLLSTLVHEFAHHVGVDGSLQHERAIERIFADIVMHISAANEERDAEKKEDQKEFSFSF